MVFGGLGAGEFSHFVHREDGHKRLAVHWTLSERVWGRVGASLLIHPHQRPQEAQIGPDDGAAVAAIVVSCPQAPSRKAPSRSFGRIRRGYSLPCLPAVLARGRCPRSRSPITSCMSSPDLQHARPALRCVGLRLAGVVGSLTRDKATTPFLVYKKGIDRKATEYLEQRINF